MKEIRIETEALSIHCKLLKVPKGKYAFILDTIKGIAIGHIDFSKHKLKYEYKVAGINTYSLNKIN